ncbi:acetyl-CoA decarbonylase/synthase complex subunit delta [Candidatus Desantisbacteria bacterium CG1_02_38_46]|uniref:Acetyl-CoA decarbonylase/synthase complex subunit delta n=2 Tax=unclassified Candidatus Desantisiibacteriota TaxID=3106372 RepID=A0A1J4SE25_9BACT|nr:MAG: acetyl-CoA decarbonylase/synthase complex subunit delta [Candidatus Desantisbacteria bacterium CG1_02_38_46]PIU51498.1 MAG: acetyl-CoA decarbonylase/synthase complex subunit delta [Candidatus Desantisbacteria bacterium CG07_land_8_20_14_0_80_39_15]
MAIEIPKIKYSGKIKEVKLGNGEKQITVGGETSYPFHLFEGEMLNPPRIAMEVYDSPPEEWPETCLEPFKDVINSPKAWAKKCIEQFGADMVSIRLISTDPNGMNKSTDDVLPIVQEVAGTIDVPLIIWGCENDDKDAEVLPKVAEVCQDKKIIIGPATDKNYKKIGAACIAYGHTIVASTPIDINLAKQLNILLGDLGVPDGQIIIDLNIGGCTIGYGLEYAYSVMERQRQAALTQQDEKLQFPVICNFANDVWKKKEVQIDDPKLGDKKNRGILFEAITGWIQLLAGADILVMRHPEAVKLLKGMLKQLM